MTIEPGEVHVWLAPLDLGREAIEARVRLLDDEERKRAERLAHDGDRRRFVASHHALRRVLSEVTGDAAAGLRFESRCATCGAADHGKPGLAGHDVEFSLAHSGELALIAVAVGRPVGVDVERERPELEAERLARRFFHPSEVDRLAGLAGEERNHCFVALWTAKEAYLKALGVGLAGKLDSFSVAPAAGDRFALQAEAEDRPWTIRRLDPGNGYAAAVAAPGKWRLRTRALG